MFGSTLVDAPVMSAVLADLALESEAATALMVRLAAAVDHGETDLLRMAVAAGKFWVCQRSAPVVAEALECLGGNGYVEESGLPRLYREAPLNSIWEGSGNVVALDVLRAVRRDPCSVAAVLAEVDAAAGADARLDAAADRLRAALVSPDPAQARDLAARICLVLQGSFLVRLAPPYVADAFCATRLGGEWGPPVAGILPAKLDVAAIVDRARPA